MQPVIAISLAAVLLTGCAQQAALINLADGRCTGAQVALVDKHIAAQIDALGARDWELAFSFASKDFQAGVGVDQFITIIESQYGMLIKNQGYQFNDCKIADGMIAQEVSVRSGDEVFNLTYKLSVKESTLGVESAVIAGIATQRSA